MKNHLKLWTLLGLVLLIGCPLRPRADVKHVSLKIFEVVDCKTSGMAPLSLKGTTEQYCLTAKPIVNETDVRRAQASRDESGKPRLVLLFTLKTGQRLRETTERIQAEHLRRKGQGRVGIVIDGTLIGVPILREVVSDSLVIDGTFTWADAVQIAESLNANPPSTSSNGQR